MGEGGKEGGNEGGRVPLHTDVSVAEAGSRLVQQQEKTLFVERRFFSIATPSSRPSTHSVMLAASLGRSAGGERERQRQR